MALVRMWNGVAVGSWKHAPKKWQRAAPGLASRRLPASVYEDYLNRPPSPEELAARERARVARRIGWIRKMHRKHKESRAC